MTSFADFQQLFDKLADKLCRFGVIAVDGKGQSPCGNPHTFQAFYKAKVFIVRAEESGEGFLAIGRNVDLPWLVYRIFPPMPVALTNYEPMHPARRT